MSRKKEIDTVKSKRQIPPVDFRRYQSGQPKGNTEGELLNLPY